jgi:hypothetical protein
MKKIFGFILVLFILVLIGSASYAIFGGSGAMQDVSNKLDQSRSNTINTIQSAINTPLLYINSESNPVRNEKFVVFYDSLITGISLPIGVSTDGNGYARLDRAVLNASEGYGWADRPYYITYKYNFVNLPRYRLAYWEKTGNLTRVDLSPSKVKYWQVPRGSAAFKRWQGLVPKLQ